MKPLHDLAAKKKRGKRSIVESLVRERRGGHEKKLAAARLTENLVHEEYDVNVKHVYDFSEGKDAKEVGGFGEVQVVRHRRSGAKFAMKTVVLSKLKDKTAFDCAMREVDLLKWLDHPNIVRLQDVYVTHTHLHMAMDLMEGGNLAVRYVYEGEEKAAHIVRQVVRALRYLHDRNIAHRDLKLENILLEHKGSGAMVKLIDFGLSAVYEENGVSTDVLGSWNYVAPEVIMGKYLPAPADMWSLGVVTFSLIGGKRPFDDINMDRVKQRVLGAKYAFSGPRWVRSSANSRHFVRSLLQRRPSLRANAAEAQRHAWLKGAEEKSQAPRSADPAFVENVTQAMRDFRRSSPMKQLALEVVARTLDPAQIRLLAEEFDRADNTNDGEVSLPEFQRWMAANESAEKLTEEEVEELFRAVDVDRSGLIHFNEFLAATISQHSLNEATLKAAFDRMDRSHTGFINLEDITLITGKAANEEESAALVGQFDCNGDGRVSFPEFVKGMRRADSSSDDNKRISASVPPPSYLSSNSAGEASEPSSEHPREAVAATSHQESREEFSDRNSGDAESAAAANAEGRGSRAANRGRKGIPVQERVTVSRVLAAGTASENRGIGGEQLMVAAEGTSSSRSIAKGISTRCGCVVS